MNSLKFLSIAFSVVGVVSCGDKTEGTSDAVDTVVCHTITMMPERREANFYYVGEIRAKTTTALSFALPGMVKTVYVKSGDRVDKGQLLAELDPTDIKNSYDIAEASLNQALDAERRIKMMHDEQSVADIKFVEVETKVEQAKAAYAEAKKRLSDTKLYAPVSGVIGNRTINPGENTGLGIAAFHILDVKNVEVVIPVPEKEIPDVQIGDKATVTVPALGAGAKYNVEVYNIGVSSNTFSHSYDVSFIIDNSNGKLRDGMVCEVRLCPRSVSDNKGFIVPVACVNINSQSQHYVWLVRDGRATRQVVIIDSYAKAGIYISAGLKKGDKVITDGIEGLSEDAVIKNN